MYLLRKRVVKEKTYHRAPNTEANTTLLLTRVVCIVLRGQTCLIKGVRIMP